MMLAFTWEGLSAREAAFLSILRLQNGCALPKQNDLAPMPTVPQTLSSTSMPSVVTSFRRRVQHGREQMDPPAVSIPGVNF